MLKYKIPQIVTLTRSSFSALLNYMRIPTKKLLTHFKTYQPEISAEPQLTSTCLHGAGKLA